MSTMQNTQKADWKINLISDKRIIRFRSCPLQYFKEGMFDEKTFSHD